MHLDSYKLLGIDIVDSSLAKLGRELGIALSGDKKLALVKVNTELLRRQLNDTSFKRTLHESDVIIPDGRGVQWAAKYLTMPVTRNKFMRPIQSVWQMIYSGAAIVLNPSFISYPITEVFPGIEAFNLMLQAVEDSGKSVYFFGAKQKDLELAIENIRLDHPKLKIAGFQNGYDFQSDSKVDPVADINKTDAALLIVALGSPKQEYWIHENLPKLKHVKVAVGEGGTLVRIAYPRQKAPTWVNRLGLEWLWRLFFNSSLTEGRGRWKRFWDSVPRFIYEMVKWKIKNGYAKVTK